MAINKANSPAWVKVTLIVLIVAFVASVTGAGLFSFFANLGGGDDTTGTTPGTSTADAQYQGAVDALTAQLQSQPESYTVLVSLGNTYFDWAVAKQQETNSLDQAAALWTSAKDAYARAVAVNNTESPVRVDFAITLFYTGDTAQAIEVAEGVVEDDPEFGPAYFNLGVFLESLGENERAVPMFQRYLELDPQGAGGGDPEYARQQISAFQSGATTTTP